jgi:hypothetical protein
VDYDLTRLSDLEFEHLSQALALRVLGLGVSVFGQGPDGGREATFEGRSRFPEPGEPWDGYGVVQAKFKRRLVGGSQDTDAFLRAVRAELDAWADPESKRVKQGKVPQYLLLTTNVVLSAASGTGGIDSANALIKGYADRLGLKGWQVWHHNQICRLLDLHADIRRTYAAFITPSDVLARLAELLGGTPATLAMHLALHAAKELTAQRWVRLGEAGHPTNDKLLLGDVVVDLPAIGSSLQDQETLRRLSGTEVILGEGDAITPLSGRVRQVPGVVAYLIGRGDTVFRPSRKTTAGSRTVIVGGPGQGKSTLGQLLCQVYRVALLEDRPESSLGPDAGQVLRNLRSQLARLSIPIPACRRWPLLVKLSAYGDAIAGGEDISLLRYLAEQVSRRLPSPVTAGDLWAWLEAWPWLIVLDGLDEVAAPTVRADLLRHVSDFLADAAAVDADLMVVATTRPQGYAAEFPAAHYEHLELRPVNRREAMSYGRRLAAVRHAGDPDMQALVLARLAQAAEEPITARLMQSPLQITIISILLERRARAPQDRHSLFDAYYQTIYEREVGKPATVGLGQLLDTQRGNIDTLHEQVGLLLQIRAERGGDAEAFLPKQDLHDLALQRLHDEGYPDDQAEALAGRLVKAATDRLVLLVPLTADAVGFEVRSLQEFMAARALVAAEPAMVVERLRRLAASAHWRNTWLLAAGRVFARHEHLRDRLVTLLQEVDTESLLAMLVLPGARLAIDILDDDIAAQAPRYRRLFAKRALELLEFAPEFAVEAVTQRLADTLLEVCQADPQIRGMVDQALQRALVAKTVPATVSAMAVLAQWEQSAGPIPTTARQQLLRMVNSLDRRSKQALAPLAFRYPDGPLRALLVDDPLRNRKMRPGNLANRVRAHVQVGHLEPQTRQQVDLLLDRVARVRLVPQAKRSALYDVDYKYDDGLPDDDKVLADSEVQGVIVTATEELAMRDWQTAGVLRGILANWFARRPAEDLLLGRTEQ